MYAGSIRAITWRDLSILRLIVFLIWSSEQSRPSFYADRTLSKFIRPRWYVGIRHFPVLCRFRWAGKTVDGNISPAVYSRVRPSIPKDLRKSCDIIRSYGILVSASGIEQSLFQVRDNYVSETEECLAEENKSSSTKSRTEEFSCILWIHMTDVYCNTYWGYLHKCYINS